MTGSRHVPPQRGGERRLSNNSKDNDETSCRITDDRSIGRFGDGVRVDRAKNRECVGGKGGVISAAGSSVTVVVIPTDEEYMISLDVERLAK